MKKIILLAVAFTAMLASCVKHDQNDTPNKVDPEAAKTMSAIEFKVSTTNSTRNTSDGAAGMGSNVEFTGGFAMVFDIDGQKVGQKVLTTGAQTTAERLDGTFVANARVLVLGNLTTGDQAKLEAAATLNAVWEVLSTVPADGSYSQAPLANVDLDGDNDVDFDDLIKPTQVGSSDVYIATTKISPVISRIEMLDIAASNKGNGDPVALGADATVKTDVYIKSFDVTGVYLSNFHTEFSYNGSAGTTTFVQDETNNADFSALKQTWPVYADGSATVADAAVVAATQSATWVNNFVSKPAKAALADNTKIWSYNVAASGRPNIIIRLRNVVIRMVQGDKEVTTLGGTPFTASTTFYLRIAGYTLNGAPVDNLKRGTIYRIGGTSAPLNFSPGNLMLDPVRDVDKTFDVKVGVMDWNINNTGPIYQ